MTDAIRNDILIFVSLEGNAMTFQDYFPVWDQLNAEQQSRMLGGLTLRNVKKGTVLHNGNADCTGLLLVKLGQLRAYILSDEGREITIYRLFDRDLCLFSASCIMRSIQHHGGVRPGGQLHQRVDGLPVF